MTKFVAKWARLVCVAVLGATLAISFISSAWAKPQFSALAIDARTGAVLYDEASNGLRHPASLTKMMTLYILFQELKARHITMSTPLRVSRRAASMAPSKMGLKPGSTITVEKAIQALIIKSANDVAATVGENLANGSESAFAVRMTRTARSIGMSRTTFKNASGLPNPAQVTTARDMATLGLRLMRDFPQYYPYFRATSFTFNGRVVRTHNRLVERFQGTDGIKTGYIGAAGFNLVTSTLRNGKRVVGVVLGARSSGSRNAFMMTMINRNISKAKAGTTIAAVAGSSRGAINPLAMAKTEEPTVQEETPAQAAVDQPADEQPDTAQMAAIAENAADNEDEADADIPANATEPVVVEAKLQPKSASTAGSQKLPFAVKPLAKQSDAMPVASLPESYSVQVSTFASKQDALAAMGKLKSTAKSEQAYTVTVKKGQKLYYRVLISGLTENIARQSCAKATSMGKNCSVVPPQG